MQPQQFNISLRALIILILIIPAAVFMAAVIHYGINIPLYDDITQILWVTNTFIEGKMSAGTPEFVLPIRGALHAIFYPNAGHVPMVTRLFAIAQYAMGGVNFYYAIIIACGAWVVTVCFLLQQTHREGLPLYALLPVPFLLFSLAQWEAMTMMLGGIQMYIGTLLLPLLTLYFLTRQRGFFAGITFFFALFASGGALSLLPIGLAYLIWRRNWSACLVFIAVSTPAVFLFKHFDVFTNNPLSYALNFSAIINFYFTFLGNIFTNGSYDLTSLSTIHFAMGIALLICGAFGLIACDKHHLIKLIFLYIVILGALTALRRGSEGFPIVPRYSIFALLVAATDYILIAAWLSKRRPQAARVFVVATTISAGILWGYSIALDRAPFALYREMRVADMQHYIHTGDASRLMWDPAWCIDVLNKSKELNVYDYTAAENFR